MSANDFLVVGVAVVFTGLMGWYFFGPRRSHEAELADGVQVIKVTVKGGYSPAVVQVASGVPVRMLFDRQESGDCSSRVVMPDFKVNQTLPAFETTTVQFTPQEPGEYRLRDGHAPRHAAGGSGRERT